MANAPTRKASRSRATVPPEILADLNAGRIETANLVEGLALDFGALLESTVPEAADLADRLRVGGILGRMQTAGKLLLDRLGADGFDRLAAHPSDTVRGWAAYVLAETPRLSLSSRLKRMKRLADDPHFGVREWAWLAVRPHVAADVEGAVEVLEPWTKAKSVNVRRFAVEITRPRGVWCGHIDRLKREPQLALPLLDPVNADPAKYVQDSVANWLNDAGKSQPDWVRQVCERWSEGADDATRRICTRALRNL